MATMITRTVKTYKATIASIGIDENGKPAVIMGESVTYGAPSENDAQARAAFKASGIKCPRGTQFVHELVSEVTYGMSLDEFMRHAEPVERG